MSDFSSCPSLRWQIAVTRFSPSLSGREAENVELPFESDPSFKAALTSAPLTLTRRLLHSEAFASFPVITLFHVQASPLMFTARRPPGGKVGVMEGCGTTVDVDKAGSHAATPTPAAESRSRRRKSFRFTLPEFIISS